MKNKILIFCAIFIANIASAQQVSYSIAQRAAKNFYNIHLSSNEHIKEATSLKFCQIENSDTLFYIFNFGKNGFVIISGDFSVSPVLAYSIEGNFIIDQQQQALQDWLQNYAMQISFAKKEKNKETNPAWNTYLNESTEKSVNSMTKGVNPLLTTRWDQGSGYNYHCPVNPSGPSGKCYAGCVATAMAQIMKYYNYPEHGYSSHSYSSLYGNLYANFDTTYYNWSAMTNSLNSASKEAISTLIFHCGVSVNMDYNPTESGASMDNVPQALKSYFHYRPSVSLVNRSSYEYDKDWKELLIDNLDQNHPILYSGSGSEGGHAFVCDGYDQDTLFHFNWGWSGANNGYFTIDSLNSGNGDFTADQQIIVDFIPSDAPYCMANRILTEPTKSISDGSGYSMYWNDTQCGWLIQPPDADKIILTFNDLETEEGKDFVTVYDGTSASDSMLGTFSGHELPPILTANSGKMFITFTSDNINQDFGWDATYSSITSGIVEKNISNAIVLYPVPAKNEINLVIPSYIKGSAIINIYNFTGQAVHSEKICLDNKTVITSDVHSLNSGIYTIEINTGKYCIHKKFIKQ
jgi:hypothetical protein